MHLERHADEIVCKITKCHGLKKRQNRCDGWDDAVSALVPHLNALRALKNILIRKKNIVSVPSRG